MVKLVVAGDNQVYWIVDACGEVRVVSPQDTSARVSGEAAALTGRRG